jgi:hypothetical protein
VIRMRCDDLQWVRVPTVSMHLGLIDRPFVPHNLTSAQERPVPDGPPMDGDTCLQGIVVYLDISLYLKGP